METPLTLLLSRKEGLINAAEYDRIIKEQVADRVALAFKHHTESEALYKDLSKEWQAHTSEGEAAIARPLAQPGNSRLPKDKSVKTWRPDTEDSFKQLQKYLFLQPKRLLNSAKEGQKATHARISKRALAREVEMVDVDLDILKQMAGDMSHSSTPSPLNISSARKTRRRQ